MVKKNSKETFSGQNPEYLQTRLVSNKLLAGVFASLLAISGLSLKMRAEIERLGEGLRDSGPSKPVATTKINDRDLRDRIADRFSRSELMWLGKADKSLDEPDEIEEEFDADAALVENLNYCLAYVGYAAELKVDARGNKSLGIKDAEGRWVSSEWLKLADSKFWESTGANGSEMERKCDSLENIATSYCNNGIDGNRQLKELLAFSQLADCPSTKRQEIAKVSQNADEAFDAGYKAFVDQSSKMRRFLEQILDVFNADYDIQSEIWMGDGTFTLRYRGKIFGRICLNQSNQIHFIEGENGIYYDKFLFITPDLNPIEIDGFVRFLVKKAGGNL